MAEILKLKIPSIVIPFEQSLDNHQMKNSDILTEYDIGWVITEKDFNIKKFNSILKKLMVNDKVLKKINKNYLKLENYNKQQQNNNTPNQIIEKLILSFFNEKK